MEGHEDISGVDGFSTEEVEDLLSDPMGGPVTVAPLPRVNLPHCLPAPGGDYVSAYTALANGYPMLEPDHEHALAVAWATGDQDAGDTLVVSHLRLVIRYAHRHAGQVEVLDLIQEGCIGLVKALQRFDPHRGIRFSSYAKWWIKESICRYLLSNVRLVELGSTRAGRTLFYQLRQTRQDLINEGLTPTPSRVAERLDVPESEVAAVSARLDSAAASLTATVGDDGRQLQDVVADDAQTQDHTVDCERASTTLAQDLEHFATTLRGHIERYVWALRLCATQPLTVSELAVRLRVKPADIQASEDDLRGRLLVWVTG